MIMKTNNIIPFFCGLAFISILGASCHSAPKEENTVEPKITLSSQLSSEITLDTAKMSNVRSDLTLFAKISADQDQLSRIYPLASGLVLSVKAMLGDHVTEGQELATLRSSDVNDFQNQYTQALNTLHLAQKNASIAEELYKTKVYSERDLLTARSELKKAQSDSARVSQLFTIYGAKADNKVPEYRVISPVDGYVIEKNITPNMAVRTDNGTNLFTISPLRHVWVLADVYESDLSKIKLGQMVDVITVAYPDTVFKGIVEQVSSIIDPVSKTLKIRAVLENKNGMLKPEMFAHVKVNYVEPAKMVSIPSSAIVFEGSKNFVMVYHSKDVVETREVTVYKDNNKQSYISAGLKEGEAVVTKYAQLVFSTFNSKS
jgi:cobalt-zinc-cadmium efflux system membrane fusion protein